jgi:hypothetical protein
MASIIVNGGPADLVTPGFHVLTKDPGNTLQIFWTAVNEGNASGTVFLRLLGSPPINRDGAVVTLAPGQQSVVEIVLTIPANSSPGTWAMNVQMITQAGVVAGHNWTLTIRDETPSAPVIVPVLSSPTIG